MNYLQASRKVDRDCSVWHDNSTVEGPNYLGCNDIFLYEKNRVNILSQAAVELSMLLYLGGSTVKKRYQTILSLLLVVVAVFLVSCGSPKPVAKGPTYTTAQLQEIQKYADDVQEMRDRLLGIPPLVQQERWVDVQSYIHGPLGEMRSRMSRLARSLEPKLQKSALSTANDVFEHLNLIDEATQTRDNRKALLNYNEALKDFDAFLQYLPSELNA